MAWTLCSKADVISIHPTSESALQDLWSDAVEGLIREYLGTPNLGKQTEISSELHSGENSTLLLVSHPPVVAVSSVLVNGYAVPASEYAVTQGGIELLHGRFPEGVLNVSISYTSGSSGELADIDPIIRMTAAAMVVAVLQYRSRAGADSSIKWGSADTREGERTPTYNIGLTSHLQTIMRRMLRKQKIRVH